MAGGRVIPRLPRRCTETVQQHQPDGVPPLELTGERTLPDVPAENYWFRRHLAVYEWIAERCAGLDVVDMACGEGYGTDVLARRARAGDRRRRQPRGPRARPRQVHASRGPLRARPDRDLRRALRRHRLPPDDRARQGAREGARATSRRWRRRPTSPRPNLLTLAPEGAEKSDNPWHLREYRAQEFRALCERSSSAWSCTASSTPASCGRTSSRCAPAGTACTPRSASPSRSTTASPRPSRRATSSLREADARPRAGLRRGAAVSSRRRGRWRWCSTRTCPTSRASAPGRSARSGSGRRSPASTCRCSTCSTARRSRSG